MPVYFKRLGPLKAGMFLSFSIFFVVWGNLFISCKSRQEHFLIQTVSGAVSYPDTVSWLSHEHILVDFTGADSLDPNAWNHDSVILKTLPFLHELKQNQVGFFVDATPAYLGRDVNLLEKISRKTGLQIITNTGFYGAVNNKYIPGFAFTLEPETLAEIWIRESTHGIDGTPVKPGFIKIGVDATDILHPMQQKLVKAAALSHLKTGLTIASHTGEARGLWPQLNILKETGVSPRAFIWVHAQNEKEDKNYLRAATAGCWISLDGLGWDLQNHVNKLIFAREQGILDRILISHDAGWYDPKKTNQTIRPYTAIFLELIPALKTKGFKEEDLDLLLKKNPARAFGISVRKI